MCTTFNQTQPTSQAGANLTSIACEVLAKHYDSNAPQFAIQVKLERTGVVEQTCNENILAAHCMPKGKLTVENTGRVCKEGGRSVEAFAFELGRFEVGDTLYRGLVVDMLVTDVYLLWIRSNITFLRYHELFPIIGTYKDWQILKKCIARFSPKSCSHRYVVNLTE